MPRLGKARAVVSFAGPLLLGACSLFAPQERIRVEKLHNEGFAPKARPSEVAIHYGEIASPFVSLARIEAQGLPSHSINLLLEEMQERAAALGADALIRVRTGWRLAEGERFGSDLQRDYGLGPLSDASGPKPLGAKQIPWAVAIAVRIEKGKKSP